MNTSQRTKIISGLIHTSVDDCRISLNGYTDPTLLCDLLIKCNSMGHMSREQVVRQRISKLMKMKMRR